MNFRVTSWRSIWPWRSKPTLSCQRLDLDALAARLDLDAQLADYDEDNPAKLVAGYGGTINLMASLIFTALLLVGVAFPLLPGASALGPWRWIVDAGWTVVVTVVVTRVWSTIFLRMSWHWFARLG